MSSSIPATDVASPEQAVAIVDELNKMSEEAAEGWHKDPKLVRATRESLMRAFRADPSVMRRVTEALVIGAGALFRKKWISVTGSKMSRKCAGKLGSNDHDLSEEEMGMTIPELTVEEDGFLEEEEEDVLSEEDNEMEVEGPGYEDKVKAPEPVVTAIPDVISVPDVPEVISIPDTPENEESEEELRRGKADEEAGSEDEVEILGETGLDVVPAPRTPEDRGSDRNPEPSPFPETDIEPSPLLPPKEPLFRETSEEGEMRDVVEVRPAKAASARPGPSQTPFSSGKTALLPPPRKTTATRPAPTPATERRKFNPPAIRRPRAFTPVEESQPSRAPVVSQAPVRDITVWRLGLKPGESKGAEKPAPKVRPLPPNPFMSAPSPVKKPEMKKPEVKKPEMKKPEKPVRRNPTPGPSTEVLGLPGVSCDRCRKLGKQCVRQLPKPGSRKQTFSCALCASKKVSCHAFRTSDTPLKQRKRKAKSDPVIGSEKVGPSAAKKQKVDRKGKGKAIPGPKEKEEADSEPEMAASENGGSMQVLNLQARYGTRAESLHSVNVLQTTIRRLSSLTEKVVRSFEVKGPSLVVDLAVDGDVILGSDFESSEDGDEVTDQEPPAELTPGDDEEEGSEYGA